MQTDVLLQTLGIVNLVTLLLYIADYLGAMNRGFRFPNVIIWLPTIAFGSFGAFVGVYTSGHKLERPEFRFGIPCLVVAHLFALAILMM